MHYVSTRGKGRPVTFDRAVLEGQAPDGGLYVPVRVPEHAASDYGDVARLDELAMRVLPDWVGRTVDDGLAAEVFSIDIPVVDLGVRARGYEGIHVVELFHGPTGSFKDFGARFLARWLSSRLPPPEAGRFVLVATSGDTGSAVAEGFAGQPRTSVIVLYPKEGVSSFQRGQLTRPRKGVYPYAVQGSFDDCQQTVKEAFRDETLSHMELISANSINIGRLLPQMLFYFWGALRIGSPDPLFVVPSGNLGNLCAGLMAARSGMPNARFIAATNKNRYLVDYLAGSEVEVRPVRPSISNAMDVAVPSNLERMIHLFGRSGLRARVTGFSVTDDETRAAMHKVWSEAGYVVDPHTAVGLAAATASAPTRNRPTLIMGTAHPDKYRELVRETTGVTVGPDMASDSGPAETVIDSGLPALRDAILETVERNSQWTTSKSD